MSEADLFRIAARMKWPGCVLTGSGAFALVRSRFNQAPQVSLYPTAEEARTAQYSIGGQRVHIEPAPAWYRVPITVGWE